MQIIFDNKNSLTERAAKILAALPDPVRESFLVEAVIRHGEASPLIEISENSGSIDIQAYAEMTGKTNATSNTPAQAGPSGRKTAAAPQPVRRPTQQPTAQKTLQKVEAGVNKSETSQESKTLFRQF